jgi:hypothetical protein
MNCPLRLLVRAGTGIECSHPNLKFPFMFRGRSGNRLEIVIDSKCLRELHLLTTNRLRGQFT